MRSRLWNRAIAGACSAFLLAAIPALVLADRAPAALYRGGGHGIKVKFRIAHREIVRGRIWTTEFCIDRKGGRSRHRVRVYIGDYVHDKRLPKPPLVLFMPQRVSAGGRFRYDSRYREPAFARTLFFGHARPGLLTGGFLQVDNGVFGPQGTSCRTDRFHHPKHRSKRSGILHFRAHRVA
jgi:hypothetical protein